MKYMDDTVILESQQDLQKYLEKYNCKDFNELSTNLWYEFGIDVQYREK